MPLSREHAPPKISTSHQSRASLNGRKTGLMYVCSLIKDLRWTGSAVHTFHRLLCAINEYCGIVILQRISPQWRPNHIQASPMDGISQFSGIQLRLELLVCDAIIRRRTEVTTCEQCDDDRQPVARDQKVAQTLGCIPRTGSQV